jgi:hypothetical protein
LELCQTRVRNRNRRGLPASAVSKSSGRGWSRQKRPPLRQQCLKSLPEPHGQRSLRPSFSSSSFSPWTMRAGLNLRFGRIAAASFAHGLERSVRRCWVCVAWDTSGAEEWIRPRDTDGRLRFGRSKKWNDGHARARSALCRRIYYSRGLFSAGTGMRLERRGRSQRALRLMVPALSGPRIRVDGELGQSSCRRVYSWRFRQSLSCLPNWTAGR